jgi:hypothetical protein
MACFRSRTKNERLGSCGENSLTARYANGATPAAGSGQTRSRRQLGLEAALTQIADISWKPAGGS